MTAAKTKIPNALVAPFLAAVQPPAKRDDAAVLFRRVTERSLRL